MTPEKLLLTSGLLGIFVLFGGAYGTLFTYGSYARRAKLVAFSQLCYGVQCVVAVAILALSPLWWYWKVFLSLSCAAYFFIPPLTLRYLIRLHQSAEH